MTTFTFVPLRYWPMERALWLGVSRRLSTCVLMGLLTQAVSEVVPVLEPMVEPVPERYCVDMKPSRPFAEIMYQPLPLSSTVTCVPLASLPMLAYEEPGPERTFTLPPLRVVTVEVVVPVSRNVSYM